MEIQPISSIECVLLHKCYAAMDFATLKDYIAVQAQLSGCKGTCYQIACDAQKVIYAVGDYCIAVTQANETLPLEGFSGCLPQPITSMMMPDAEQRVMDHRAHTFIAVTRNQALQDFDLAPRDDEEWSGNFVSTKDALRAMTLTYRIADVVHRNNPASAFHWLPSDHLASPQAFELAGQGASLTSFFIRPYLFSSDGAIAEDNTVGMVSNGSQYLLPKPLIFSEAPVSVAWMIKRSIQFIDRAIFQDSVPEHGSAFSVEDDEIIEVLHKDPEPANPMGSYTLVARNVPGFDIRGGLQAVLMTGDEESEKVARSRGSLNEEDPIDLAILNALRERMEAEPEPIKLPLVGDRRMGPRETHRAATFGKRKTFGRR